MPGPALGDCPLCLEPLDAAASGELAVTFLPCAHALHEACAAQLRGHATASRTCPVCRAPLDPDAAPTHALTRAAGVAGAGVVLTAASGSAAGTVGTAGAAAAAGAALVATGHLVAVMSAAVMLLQFVVACAAVVLAFGFAAAFEAGTPRRREGSLSRIGLRSYSSRLRSDGARDAGASSTNIVPRERAAPPPRRRFAIFKSRDRQTDVKEADREVRMKISVRRKLAGKVRAICNMQRPETVRMT